MIRLTVALSLVALLLPIPAAAQAPDFPRTVIDATGAAVTIPARPALIATTRDDPMLARLLPPDAIRIIPPTGAAWSGVNLLVISTADAAVYPALVASAQAAGIPAFQTAPVRALDGWRDALTRLGMATGREDRAAQWIALLDRRIAFITARVSDQTPARALILTPEGYTFGQDTLITTLIDAAGGINVAADYQDFRQIDDSAIRALAPDVILLTPAWASLDLFVRNPAYADLPAVRNGRVYRLPFSATHPPDPAADVLVLAIFLHPSALLFPYVLYARPPHMLRLLHGQELHS
jgi:ABC-type Fe3+-hydroxamate transport system substrate-binding protein